MELPKDALENVPLDLSALAPRIARLELVEFDLSSTVILGAHLRDVILGSANMVDVADGSTTNLEIDGTIWWFTESKIDAWLLLEADFTGAAVAYRYMLIPCFPTVESVQEALDALENRFPYLELTEPVEDSSNRARRGLRATALALLQGLLPEDV